MNPKRCERRAARLVARPRRRGFSGSVAAAAGLALALSGAVTPAGAVPEEVVSFSDRDLHACVLSGLGERPVSSPYRDVTIAEMESLTALDCGLRIDYDEDDVPLNPISDLGGLEYAVNLRSLNLQDQQLASIQPITALSRLTALDLGNTGIDSLSPLRGLTRLVELDVSHTPVASLAPLKELRALVSLDVYSTQVTTIGRLVELDRLESLNIAYTKVESVTALAPLKRLRTLVWGGSGRFHSVSDLRGLHKLTSLRALELEATDIASFSRWNGLPDLRTLKIERGQLSSVAGLGKMKKLEKLSLRGNRQLTSLSGFGSFSKLQAIDVSETRIKRFSGLGKLPRLKQLYASHARLTSLTGLSTYRSTLKSLDVAGNDLKSVKAIRSLTKLKKLDLTGNRISSVTYLLGMTKLIHLKLGLNRISSLKGLNRMRHMVLFQVGHQDISGSTATVGKPYTLPVLRTPGGSRIAYEECSDDCTLTAGTVTWQPAPWGGSWNGWVTWSKRVRIGNDTAVFSGTFSQTVKPKK